MPVIKYIQWSFIRRVRISGDYSTQRGLHGIKVNQKHGAPLLGKHRR